MAGVFSTSLREFLDLTPWQATRLFYGATYIENQRRWQSAALAGVKPNKIKSLLKDPRPYEERVDPEHIAALDAAHKEFMSQFKVGEIIKVH